MSSDGLPTQEAYHCCYFLRRLKWAGLRSHILQPFNDVWWRAYCHPPLPCGMGTALLLTRRIHMNKLKQPLFPGGHLHQPPPSRRTHPTLHTNCSQSRNDTKTQLLPSLAKALHEEMTTLVIIVKIHSEVRLSAYNT